MYEEGEAEEEKRKNFCGSIEDDKKTSVDTELEDSQRTSQLNPDAAEFVPVSPSRFVVDPDPVISSSPTQGYETVSYTHLDVYKRQLQDCVMSDFAGSRPDA